MSAAQAAEETVKEPVVEAPTIEVQNLGYNREETDPRVVRWGYNPGLRGVHLPTTQTGLKESLIPVGRFIPHASFETPKEYFTLDENKPKEVTAVVTSADAQEVVESALRRSGYQSLFLGQTNAAQVTVVNRTVLPSLSEIRGMFPDNPPIEGRCPASDEFDLGTPREQCATCHLRWITSDACRAYIRLVSEEGMAVRTFVDGEARTVQIRPSFDQLEEARATVERGLGEYIKYAATEWAKTVSELENKLRDKINGEEHFLRKDLHAVAPKDKGVEMVKAFAESIPATIGGTDQLAQAMFTFAEAQRETNAQTRELLAMLIGNKQAPDQADTTVKGG